MPQVKRPNMDTYKSLATLLYFLKIFSLHHISYDKPDFMSNPWPYIKVTFILFVFSYLPSYNLYLHFTYDMMSSLSPSVLVIDAIDTVLCLSVYIVDLCFTYKYKSELYTYYCNYDLVDAVYKMKHNAHIKVTVITLLAILLPSWCVSSLGQFGVWAASGGVVSSATYAVTYFTFLIRLLTALDFISQTMHIRLRMKNITDHIKECASYAEDSASRIQFVQNVTVKRIKVLPTISKCRCEIAKSSSCYLLLIKQAQFLNSFFGVRVLMHFLYTLTEMITFVNFVAKVISGSMGAVMKSYEYVLLAPNVLRAVNCFAVLSMLVYYCEACCRESASIIEAVDYYLVNKKTNEELASSLKSLQKLVTSRPPKFTAAGFFNIEFTLLLSLISVVITYALILVQSTS